MIFPSQVGRHRLSPRSLSLLALLAACVVVPAQWREFQRVRAAVAERERLQHSLSELERACEEIAARR